MSKVQRQARLEHANALIRIIGGHGRRFFWYGGSKVWDPETKTSKFVPADRYAYFEIRNGRVYFIDDYTCKATYLAKTGFRNSWRNFSHGGTLRALVEDMYEYIVKGTPVPRWKIVIQQLGCEGLEGNIWGYEAAAAQAVREAAYALPIIEQA